MKLRSALRPLLGALLVLATPLAAFGQERVTLDLEAAQAVQLRNDFAVPGDTGMLVRLDERAPALVGRIVMTWRINDAWSLRALAAPLSVDSEFIPARTVEFHGTPFAVGQPVTVDYRFDSYRVGVYRRFGTAGDWSFRAGATLKLRDAEIALRSAAATASKSNRGVVPLLYGGARVELSERVALDFDADAAAAPQGRAIDAALRLESKLSDRASIYAGGRVLDGGADNDEVYSFATFAYGVVGLRVNW